MPPGILAVALAALLLCGFSFENPGSQDPSQQFDQDNVQRQDTPNDPDYDVAESDDPQGGTSTNIFDERFDLFGFPSERTRTTAFYKEGPNANPTLVPPTPQVSGFNAAGAWKLTRGKPEVSVAILDTGINWDSRGVRNKVALNADELPTPSGGDADGNGILSVDDFAAEPKVKAITDDDGQRDPTAEDLIKAYSDGKDTDGNGYVDDIAGWDFFDDDNNPRDASSYFAASNHGTGRTNEAVEEGNDAKGSIGVCPKCQFIPLRIWDTFVSDQNNFAMAITYATDNGAEVIEGADGGLYHSAFAEAATKYAYDHGVAQLYSGNDLNTGNHNYPAAYNHTQLVEGTVADAKGLGMDLPSDPNDPGLRGALASVFSIGRFGTSVPVQTYFRGANTTQFGGKSSISMEGTTGSANTGKAAGAAALVISAGEGDPLSADETRELLEQTAEDVLPRNTDGTGTPDPSQPGFDTHFGYGRVNLGEAVRSAKTGGSADSTIPPEASIGSPDWYAPLTGSTAQITGLARDRRHPGDELTWTLEYGLGLAPTEFTKIRDGRGAETDFGGLPLDDIRTALANRGPTDHTDRDDPAGPTLDPTREDPYKGQFTVRLRVTSGADRTGKPPVLLGEDRKVLTALDPVEQKLRPGFPKDLGSGGEAPLRYADLDGDNVEEIVLPTEDGLVHAFPKDGKDGKELTGWPVETRTQVSAAAHVTSPALKELDPPLEPPRAATVADITGDGRPEVITAAGERIYVWDAKGKLLPGWPVRPDLSRANCAPSQQSKPRMHPKCGFLGSASVAFLEGRDKLPAVVVPGLDGRLRAYRPDGSTVPNFPKQLVDPDVGPDERVIAESINNPAIGDLDGDGADDVVVATNEVYGSSGGGNDVSFAGVLSQAGTTSRVYAVSGKTGEFLPGWPIKLGGVIQDVLPLIGPGHDASLVKIDGVQQVVVSTTGSTSIGIYDKTGTLTREINQSAAPAEGALNLFESAVVGDVDGLTGPDIVKYQIDAGQAANLLLVGQNFPYSHRIGAFDARTGTAKPGFPVITDDYQFLSSSTVAKVVDGDTNQVVAGTGLGLLHAYDGVSGLDVAGFPKVTGGWLFAPAALSADGRVAGITREGFLYEWDQATMPACQSEWPSFRHDPQGSGNYDRDGTAPGAPTGLKLTSLGGNRYRLEFRSPGDDGLCGTAKRYVADIDGQPLALGEPVAGGEPVSLDITVPAGARRIAVRAQDEAGNLGQPGGLVRTVAAGGGFDPVGSNDVQDDPPVANPAPVGSTPSGGASGGGGNPGGGGGGNAGGNGNGQSSSSGTPATRFPAKISLARATVRRSDRVIDVLAPITGRASGRVRVAFRAAGRTTRFTVRVDAANRRLRFRHAILAAQARLGTGILTLSYPGDADTRPQVVRLRAARRPARLQASRPTVSGNTVRASGQVTGVARGVVRLQLQFDDANGQTQTVGLRARIRKGRWSLRAPLPRGVASRRGSLHSYTLFTGYFPRRVRGELRSYQVLGAR